tara:strand:- start:2596 stop:6822 length:4227 start_codon:yes stop_codon:yes gene_type:complete
MAKYYQDFVGLNTFVYDSSSYEDSNTLGWEGSLDLYQNADFLANFSTVPQNPDFFNALMSHRGNVYGYPIWRQIRASNNPLSRRLRRGNVFNYTKEPSTVIRLIEPVVIQNSPISLIGEVSIYNEDLGIFEKKPVEIKTALNNETSFFANDEANQHFNTILETDENYEALKEMYLDGGLDDEGSMLDAFSLLTYRQTIWPKQQYAYLNQTRSRTFYVNTFWRDNRDDRELNDVETGFSFTAPSQSMWPLDAAVDFATRTRPTGDGPHGIIVLYPYTVGHRTGGQSGQNTEGGEGILQNSYSQIKTGQNAYDSTVPANFSFRYIDPNSTDASIYLSSSVCYSRRHTIKSTFSNFNPSFPTLGTDYGLNYPYLESPSFDGNLSLLTLDGSASLMLTSSLFEGVANWDTATQAGKSPFYDSYQDYAQDIRNKGKGYSIIPEFRISSHVETYVKKGVTQQLESIFELSGATKQNTTTENQSNFYKIISNSEFLKHFDLIKKDHESFAGEKILTLKCKGLKKFLPYEGFYPAQRTVQMGQQFHKSYSDFITAVLPGEESNPITGGIAPQAILEPLFAPGVLFNTIKSGVAVDFPILTPEDEPILVSSSNNNNNGEWNSIPGTPGYEKMDPEGPYHNYYWGGSNRAGTSEDLQSMYSKRIPFEALVEPESYISNLEMILQEPNPLGLTYGGDDGYKLKSKWSGGGDQLYKKMANNILAEIPEFFLENKNMKTLTSLEEQDPGFGNAVSGNYYAMRIKMDRSRVEDNRSLGGYYGSLVDAPQDLVTYQDRNFVPALGGNVDILAAGNIKARFSTKESLTMYSRPSAFGPPTYAGNGFGIYRSIEFREAGSWWGLNYPYTPPYYHGQAWCDLIFYADETRKYTLEEIMSSSMEYPYYTRFWWNGTMDAVRDLTGYSGSNYTGSYSNYRDGTWHNLIKENGGTINTYDYATYYSNGYTECGWGSNDVTNGSTQGTANNPSEPELLWHQALRGTSVGDTPYLPQHPFYVNYNAMQLDSSINLFGKGTVRKVFNEDRDTVSEVASADTVRGKTRWIIQPKFETPILNFKKYEKLTENAGVMPLYASESVPRGMWHQYGDIPEDPKTGVFLQVTDIPRTWLKGALGIKSTQRNIASLADLVGFSKEPVRLGEVASQKEISECVVAVPFIEQDATRKFFSIPRTDIDSSIEASRREIDGRFPAGGPAKTGDTVYQMVKKMKKYVFPPSMDFVRYEEIEPFAMYIFEFKHTLSKQDLADIWQNLPPTIGTQMEEAESSISHELLAAELLGDGAVVKNNVLDENAEGKGIPSNIQWMIFKVKKRAKTNYFDKIVAKKGTTEDTSDVQLIGVTNAVAGKKDKEITYNWPYDFFSLVELVKIDAEVSFANIENDDKGQRSIKKVESEKTRDPSMINKARGKGRIE